MKKVNFDARLERRKAEIMAQFEADDAADWPEQAAAPATAVSPDGLPAESPAALTDDELKDKVIDALKTVYDPEIPVNIFDLGLIYNIRIANGFVDIDMTLTAPGCPVAHSFPGMVERSVCLVPGVSGAAVELVWEPPWTVERISEAARLELGLI